MSHYKHDLTKYFLTFNENIYTSRSQSEGLSFSRSEDLRDNKEITICNDKEYCVCPLSIDTFVLDYEICNRCKQKIFKDMTLRIGTNLLDDINRLHSFEMFDEIIKKIKNS